VEIEDERRLMQEAVDCFNAGRFFDCHEFFEDLWNEEPPRERKFMQGLIQIAVGCEHFKRGNLRGAISLTTQGLDKIRAYGSRHRGVRLAQLAHDAGAALEQFRMANSGQLSVQAVRLPSMIYAPDEYVSGHQVADA
jgi:predicted metal-dependent hydrolase